MFSTDNCVLQKERITASALLGIGLLFWTVSRLHVCPELSVGEPLRPAGIGSSSVRSGLEHRLLLSGREEEIVVAELPSNLGHLEPKGRTNPDGSEVWGYPNGSPLEEVIEVHVKDGRVVREVLRPSSKISLKALRD